MWMTRQMVQPCELMRCLEPVAEVTDVVPPDASVCHSSNSIYQPLVFCTHYPCCKWVSAEAHCDYHCVQVGGGKLNLSYNMGSTHWYQLAQHMSPLQQVPDTS